MKLVCVTNISPHRITDGYTLRVKSVVEFAARLPAMDIHVVTPVSPADSTQARAWAETTGVTLHATEFVNSSVWDAAQRSVFKRDIVRVLGDLDGIDNARVIVHGLQPMADLASLPESGRWIGDLVDEAGPRISALAHALFLSGKLIQGLHALNNLRWYRYRMLPSFAAYRRIVVVAHDDAERVRWRLPESHTEVVPNGVVTPAPSSIVSTRGTRSALFHGVFNYEPNEQAALFLMRRVAPLLRQHLPSWRIRLVGRAPSSRMRKVASGCGSVDLIADAPDIAEHLATSSLGVYPIFTRTGIQNKVLEALSHGLPVVTTPEVRHVFSRFDAEASSCILPARSAADFARHMCALACDPDLMRRMSAAGPAYVARCFTWGGAVDRLLAI